MSTDLHDISDARISASDVTGGGFSTGLTNSAIEEHIATAHDLVEDELAGKGMDENRLARIELYLTRHLIRFFAERQVDSESGGPLTRSYSGAFDHESLRATAPGQQALMLDKSNTLGVEEFDQFFAVG